MRTGDFVNGSGNVFADLGFENAAVEQAKAILAAEIINILDEEQRSVREVGRLTGVPYTDFSRIRNVDLDRFIIDRLMKILGRFERRVEVQVSVRPKTLRAGVMDLRFSPPHANRVTVKTVALPP